MSHHQARPVHAGDDPADVQDPRTQRPDPRLQPERALPRRHQVQRRTGHHAGPAAGRLFPLYIEIQSTSIIAPCRACCCPLYIEIQSTSIIPPCRACCWPGVSSLYRDPKYVYYSTMQGLLLAGCFLFISRSKVCLSFHHAGPAAVLFISRSKVRLSFHHAGPAAGRLFPLYIEIQSTSIIAPCRACCCPLYIEIQSTSIIPPCRACCCPLYIEIQSTSIIPPCRACCWPAVSSLYRDPKYVYHSTMQGLLLSSLYRDPKYVYHCTMQGLLLSSLYRDPKYVYHCTMQGLLLSSLYRDPKYVYHSTMQGLLLSSLYRDPKYVYHSTMQGLLLAGCFLFISRSKVRLSFHHAGPAAGRLFPLYIEIQSTSIIPPCRACCWPGVSSLYRDPKYVYHCTMQGLLLSSLYRDLKYVYHSTMQGLLLVGCFLFISRSKVRLSFHHAGPAAGRLFPLYIEIQSTSIIPPCRACCWPAVSSLYRDPKYVYHSTMQGLLLAGCFLFILRSKVRLSFHHAGPAAGRLFPLYIEIQSTSIIPPCRASCWPGVSSLY